MNVEFHRIDWPLASVFRIAYSERSQASTVMVEVKRGNFIGRGEGIGVPYYGESADLIMAQLMAVKDVLMKGVTRAELQHILPPGGARNALDCALWDLEAKSAGRPAWRIAGLSSITPLMTSYTLSLDTPEEMGRVAGELSQFPNLKIKLGGGEDLERVRAVRRARPDATLIVDANQAWDEVMLRSMIPGLHEARVALIEQPLPIGADDALHRFRSPIPICADETCHTTKSLPLVVGKYQYINIKLDKTGGLTEALKLADAAEACGLKLMVGCMAGSSLSMAPAFIIGQRCGFVDLDGPLLAAADMPNGICYDGARMGVPEPALWG